THTVSDHLSSNVPGDPSPAVVEDQTWNPGSTPATTPTLTLKTGNVSALAIDMVRAGFQPGQVSTVSCTTDGPITLRLTHLAPNARVRIGSTTLHADSSGTAVVALPSGASTIRTG